MLAGQVRGEEAPCPELPKSLVWVGLVRSRSVTYLYLTYPPTSLISSSLSALQALLPTVLSVEEDLRVAAPGTARQERLLYELRVREVRPLTRLQN